MDHVPLHVLEQGLDHIRRSPADDGRVELIVCRPAHGERGQLREGVLDLDEGLVGDNWRTRGSSKTEDGSAHPGMQLTLMNARAALLVAARPERRELVGDQLFVDLDLSYANIPPGTQLQVGTATIEITELPHRGCGKFLKRFGMDAQRFVNSRSGRELNLRGVNAKVVAGGLVRIGDTISKVPAMVSAGTPPAT